MAGMSFPPPFNYLFLISQNKQNFNYRMTVLELQNRGRESVRTSNVKLTSLRCIRD
jgi:hypothetical protein